MPFSRDDVMSTDLINIRKGITERQLKNIPFNADLTDKILTLYAVLIEYEIHSKAVVLELLRISYPLMEADVLSGDSARNVFKNLGIIENIHDPLPYDLHDYVIE